jgi:L-malate glycosyltransferase
MTGFNRAISYTPMDVPGRRILVIPSDYPDLNDPRLLNHVWAEEQSRALMARHDIAVLYPLKISGGRGRIEEHDLRGVRAFIIRYRHVRKTWLTSYIFAMLMGFGRVRKKLWPECIHAHDLYPAGFAAVLLGRILGIPVVVTEHWGQLKERTSQNHILRGVLKFTLRQATQIIAVSEFLAEELRSIETRSRVVVIPNMVSPIFLNVRQTPSSRERDKIKILFVGSLRDYRKGLDVLLGALRLYLNSSDAPHCLLTIIGDGGKKAEFEGLARKLAIQDYCDFLGAQSRDEVAAAMIDCDVVVVPSRYETFGLIYAEAMACGKPVIACKGGPAEEFIPSWAGLLVPPDDQAALMRAISIISSNLSNYDSHRISEYARQNFAPETVVAAISNVYEQAIQARAKSGSVSKSD